MRVILIGKLRKGNLCSLILLKDYEREIDPWDILIDSWLVYSGLSLFAVCN